MSFGKDSLFPRRRYVYAACFSLIGISFFSLLASNFWSLRPTNYPLQASPGAIGHSFQSPLQELDQFDFRDHLKGLPTNNFRDNLLPNVKYITSWISAGWTNDVMTYINLIYLGILTNRVPIIPMFVPSHIGGSVPPIDFGEVFDVPRLVKAIRKPVLEWHQVKNISAGDLDELGCWNLWEAVQERENIPRRSSVPNLLKLDLSYTTTPTWIKLIPRYEHDQHSTFSSLAALATPEGIAENAVEPKESEQHRVKLPPDQQVLCYDYLYYVCSHQPYEFDFDYSPAWMFVGQHMHWTSRLEKLTDEYLRRAFGTQENEPTPPWIAIHVRHGDFSNYCGDLPHEDCYASLSVLGRRVDEAKQEILERKGIVVDHVVMTSDERNATWWKGVTDRGWFGLDHSQTVELYGNWYPVLIDAVVQSRGLGFIGTDRSTMSVLARRRTESWQDGAVRTVKWGRPESDDH
ncbi:hypothetical protein GALMADRAFT_53717 [Galerina marginata CBS 339.88]|uniref:GDP-fucose protein O-fucosyltransferase n=1 Tax=Galerina marginata (strain CBS 339.88) TaxID=685588 RepID=A0A067TQM0_GALM3|nr:hypothetical protein GALMADRAFT_53717 [Galerina marginata CBS 339.88]